jgi:hypothetical protein
MEDYAGRAIADAGFRGVLDFRLRAFLGLRAISVGPHQGADGPLVAAALRALSVRPGTRLARVRTRLH